MDDERKAERKRAAQAAGPKDEPRFAYGIELPDVESLAGLSRETAACFTTRIQPLLLNKCGNAACHGSKSESSFQLEQIRGTGNGHRVHTERNLAAVLKQIELQRPADSPLLQHGVSPHGGMARANFFGPAGEKQLKMLRNWIRVASLELRPESKPAQFPHGLAQQQQPKFPSELPIRQTAASDEESESQASIASNQSPASTTPGPLRGSVQRSSPLSSPLSRNGREGTLVESPAEHSQNRALEDEPDIEPDAFDPQEFNRRYHGEVAPPASGRKSRDRKTEP
jgi:hypothetical protein